RVAAGGGRHGDVRGRVRRDLGGGGAGQQQHDGGGEAARHGRGASGGNSGGGGVGPGAAAGGCGTPGSRCASRMRPSAWAVWRRLLGRGAGGEEQDGRHGPHSLPPFARSSVRRRAGPGQGAVPAGGHRAVKPPSTTSACPVMYWPASLAKSSTGPISSSGSPQ